MEFADKMTVLNLISENKDVLFGKFGTNVTFDMKVQKWKEITQELHEMDIFHKDWKYLRDTTWQNWRKRALEKRNNRREGGNKWKLDVADNMIINMLGKNTDLDDSDTPDTLESKYPAEAININDKVQNIQDKGQNIKDKVPNTPISNCISKEDTNNRYLKSLNRLRKEKMEADILLTKQKIEIAKREKYKLDLELLKLEKELNIRKVSSFTLPYHAADRNTVLVPDNMGQHFLAETTDHMRL